VLFWEKVLFVTEEKERGPSKKRMTKQRGPCPRGSLSRVGRDNTDAVKKNIVDGENDKWRRGRKELRKSASVKEDLPEREV